MPSLLVTGLIQALVLGAISNILAQVISAQKDGVWIALLAMMRVIANRQ